MKKVSGKLMQYSYDLAICAIMRNEGKFVKEWLDWHMMIGVEKFFIYDNESDDNMAEILRPYIEKGIVDYTYYSGRCRQVPSYNDCLKKHRYDTEWLAVIDGDEFLCPLGEDGLLAFLRKMAEKYTNMGGLGVNWRLFGSNGHIKSPTGGVIPNYTRRAAEGFRSNLHIKSIVNPRRARCFINPHYALYYGGYIAIDEQGTPAPFYLAQAGIGQLKHIYLAHYHLKSYEDWRVRKELGPADSTQTYDVSEKTFATVDKEVNDVYDDTLLKVQAKLMASQRRNLHIGERQIKRCSLEKNVQRQLEKYDCLQVEDILALYFLSYKAIEDSTESINMSAKEFRTLLCGLLHMFFTYRHSLSASDFYMVDDAFHTENGKEAATIRCDLDRLRPYIQEYILIKGNSTDMYLDRLVESNKPGYRPRVAIVTPVLQSLAQMQAVQWMVSVLLAMGMKIFVYTNTNEGTQELVTMGGRVLTDAELLVKRLDDTNWYGGIDLVIINSIYCYPLLKSHTRPVKRPILWWIHEDIDHLTDVNWQQEISSLKKHDVSTLFSNVQAMASWKILDSGWNSDGIMPIPVSSEDKNFTDVLKPLVERLIDVGVHTRYPMEEIGL